MDQMALIWTLVAILAIVSGVLVADIFLKFQRERREKQRAERKARRLMRQQDAHAVYESAVSTVADSSHEERPCAPSQRANSEQTHNVVCDLMGRPKPTMEVILPPDGKVLHLLTPTKATSDQFETIGKLLERQEMHRLSMDGVEQLFKFAAILLSNNKEGCGFLPADLKERLTSQDIGALLQSYLLWLTEVIKERN